MSAAQATASALAEAPEPSPRNIAVRVVPGAERALREGHPWLFAGSIREQSHEGAPGDLAVDIDASAPALAAAERNLAHNRHVPAVAAASHETVVDDAFDALARIGEFNSSAPPGGREEYASCRG